MKQVIHSPYPNWVLHLVDDIKLQSSPQYTAGVNAHDHQGAKGSVSTEEIEQSILTLGFSKGLSFLLQDIPTFPHCYSLPKSYSWS